MNDSEENRWDSRKDSEIWSLFKGGNEVAFNHIYRISFDRLYNYGCQFTKDKALVEDAIQDLFIDLRRRSSTLSDTDKIMPYLYTAFRRKIIRLRDKSRRFQEFDASKSVAFTFSIENSIINQEMNSQELQKLEKGINDLPEKYREIIYHFYYENHSYEEIKEILGFENVKSVRNLLYKAIKSLRKLISVIIISISISVKLLEGLIS